MVKHKNKSFYKNYMTENKALRQYQRVGVGFLVFVVSGMVGWIYEFVLAIFEHGQVYMKGGNLLPFINIYAFGALLIIPATYKVRKYPWAVFLISFFVTGGLELLGGWLVYTVGDGTRYWNYNYGPWAVWSVNGFVCLLSATLFGLSALMLMYGVFPFTIYLSQKMSKKSFLILATTLFVLFMTDEIVNLALKNTGQKTAMDFYKSLGMEYQEF